MASALVQKCTMNTKAVRCTPASRGSVKVYAAAKPASKKPSSSKPLFFFGASTFFAAPAFAEDADNVDSAVNTVVDVVKATGGVVRSGIDVLSSGVTALQQGYEIAAPVLKQGIDAVAPVLSQAYKVTSEVAVPALKAAGPVVQSGLQEATKALDASGLSAKTVSDTTSVVTKTAATATQTVSPYATQLFNFLASKDPVTLGEYALGVVALYYLAPPVLGLLGGSLRGYAGELTPATALDGLVSESGVVLIDIRTLREKEQSGVPDVPSAGRDKVLEVEFATTEDKKLRNSLRDPSSIEAQVTALQIASLKRVGKGTKIVLLDRYGPVARQVAKELSSKGFGKVFTIAGGFDGGKGWVQSKLQIKPVAGSYGGASPFAAATRIISRSDGRKALPAPAK